MTSLSQLLLPVDLLIPCLNAAVTSLVACGIAVALSRRAAWTLPVRHSLLAAALAGTLLCGLWFVGTAIGLARAIVGLNRMRRWIQSVTVADSPSLAAAANAAATCVGLRSPVPLHRSSLLPAPVTLGLLRPKIVLPAGIEASLPPDQLRAVIQHEMAHIARRDLWIGLLQQAAAIAYWWNPLVLLANRQLGDLREQICDDIAIRDLTDPGAYAATLIDLAERCSVCVPVPATLGIGTSPAGQLESRIRRILSSSEDRCIRLTRLAAAGVSAAVVLMAATILLAQVQVKSPVNDTATKENPAIENPAKYTPAKENAAIDGPMNAAAAKDTPGKADPGEKAKPVPSAPPKVASTAAAATPPAAQPQQVVATEPEPAEERDPFDRHNWGDVEVPGRVVGPDGKPVAAATIFLRKYGIRVPSRKTTTDAEGRFKFPTFRRQGPNRPAGTPDSVTKTTKLPGGITITVTESNNRQGAPHTDESEIKSIRPWIVATAPGFGFGTLVPGDDVTIKLVPDEPISGRVSDETGKPIEGARVRVRDVHWPRRADDPIALQEHRDRRDPVSPIPEGEGLDPWITAMRRAANMNDYYVARDYLIGLIESAPLGDKPALYAPLIPPVTTDTDGRFTLSGVGRERVAELYVDGVPDRASAHRRNAPVPTPMREYSGDNAAVPQRSG